MYAFYDVFPPLLRILIIIWHCLAALTVRWMMKPWSLGNENLRLIVCTGERMQGLVERLYRQVGMRTTTFKVRHMKLSNEFLCYTSFESKNLKWEHIDTPKREGNYQTPA